MKIPANFLSNSLIVVVCISLLALLPQALFSQGINPEMDAIATDQSNEFMIYYEPTTQINPKTMFTEYSGAFELGADDKMVLYKTYEDDMGYKHHRYQQYYQGVKVFAHTYIVHEKDGRAVKSNGHIASGISLSTAPSLGEQAAIDAAFAHVNAQVYYFQDADAEALLKVVNDDPNYSSYPDPELVVINKIPGASAAQDFKLAYKIDVYAYVPNEPVTVYVDATNGNILYEVDLAHTQCNTGNPGNGCTLYDGFQTINTINTVNGFTLLDDCQPGPGGTIYTLHAPVGGPLGEAFSPTVTWNNNCSAVQGHFGTRATWDYYNTAHGFNSWDGAGGRMLTIVVDDPLDIGMWIGAAVVGGGDVYFDQSLSAIDVIGHEFTHGVVSETAVLDGNREAGAIEESYADIFGALVEWQSGVDPDWEIGEDAWDHTVSPMQYDYLRSMHTPKLHDVYMSGILIASPDTYGGEYWDPNGDVHIINGVHNFWFYLLCEGSANTDEINDAGGMPDNGDVYSVLPLDTDPVEARRKAAAIAFRNLTVYLDNNSGYLHTRWGSIESAKDLFGECSFEVEQVRNAWFAVGLGGNNCLDACVETTADVNANTCTAGQTSSATISVSGGAPPYNYSWSNGQSGTSNTATGFANGMHSVTVTDQNSCNEVFTFEISLMTLSEEITNSCFGGATGEIMVEPDGGLTPYTYSWSDGAATQFNVNLAAGSYTVTVTDASNCTVEATYVVPEYPEIVVSLTVTNPSNCGLNTGAVETTVSGGVPPYTYVWRNSLDGSLASIAQDPIGLAAGDYYVVVTDTKNCTQTATVTIPSVQLPLVSVTYTVSDPTPCVGDIIDITYRICNTTGAAIADPVTLFFLNDMNTTIVTGPGNDFSSGGLLVVPPGGLINDADGDCQTGPFNEYTMRLQMDASTVTMNYLFVATGVCADPNPMELEIEVGGPENSYLDVSPERCVDACDGEIEVMVSGGVAPFTYDWAHGPNTPIVDQLCPGTYEVTITDAFGCEIVLSGTVYQALALNVGITPTPATCWYTSDGMLDANPSGGNTPYTYVWSTGSTDEVIDNIPPGHYEVTVTDYVGCEKVQIVDLGPEIITFDLTKVDISCGNTGSATISNISGGTGAYDIDWSTGASNVNTITGLSAGTYTVTVTDANNCTITGDVTIDDDPAIQLALSGTIIASPICVGNDFQIVYEICNFSGSDNLSAITIQATPGSGVNIDNSTTDDFDVAGQSLGQWQHIIPANTLGSYTCASPYQIVLDVSPTQNGATTVELEFLTGTCNTSVYTENVDVAGGYSSLNISSTNATCTGDCDGEITTSVVDAVLPLTWSWQERGGTNTFSTQNISSLCPGIYDLTITDDAGCELDLGGVEPTVGDPDPLVVNISSNPINPQCAGDPVTLTANATGGTGGSTFYTYDWSTGAQTQSIVVTTQGSYTVTVTDYTQQCTDVDVFTVTYPNPITFTVTTTDVVCGSNAGSAIINPPAGGTAPYSYQWDAAAGGVATPLADDLAEGTYAYTVSDANGCSVTGTATITQTGDLNVTENNITHLNCSGPNSGAIDIDVAGGIGGYTFAWNDPAMSVTEDVGGLTNGAYTVTVEDDEKCITEATFIVQADLASFMLPPTAVVTDANCINNTGGSIDLTVSFAGPFGPIEINGGLTYQWSNGLPPQPDNTNLGPGTYTVTVTNSYGCTVSGTFTVGIDAQNIPVTVTSAVTGAPLCKGDDFQITYTICNNSGQDNALPIELEAILGANVFIPTTPVSDFDLNGIHTIPAGALLAGNCPGSPYTITINLKASSSQVGATTVDLEFESGLCNGIIHTDNLMVGGAGFSAINSRNPLCHDDCNGFIEVIPNGGVAPYTVDWNTGANTELINNLCAGTYNFTITDAVGCTYGQGLVLHNPPLLEVEIVASPATSLCPDDLVTLTANTTGGSGPFSFYDFFWSTGDVGSGIPGSSIVVNASGTYSVTVNDAAIVCTATDDIVVAFPEDLEINLTGVDADCDGTLGSAQVVGMFGGTPPYSYTWSTGVTDQPITGLQPGTYTVTLTDANNCTTEESITIGLSGSLDITEVITPVNCNGNNSGEIDLTVTGGSGNYTFTWDNGLPATEDQEDLSIGSYSVTVDDGNGCSATATYNIQGDISSFMQAAGVVTDASCSGVADGAIDLTVFFDAGPGGQIPITTGLTFDWSNGEVTEDISGLQPGTYTVEVTNNYDCTITATFTVNGSSNLTLSGTQVNVGCNGQSTGSINLTISNGTGPYIINWSNGENSEDISGLSAGSYTVTVEDANGCTGTKTFVITEPFNRLIAAPWIFPIVCNGDENGAISMFAFGGTPPISFSWSTGQNTSSIGSLGPGTYTVTVSDANGCSLVRTVTLTDPPVLEVDAVATQLLCNGGSNGSVTANVTGGVPGYTFEWYDAPLSSGLPPFANTQTVTGLTAGTYLVVVTDSRGCQAIDKVAIKVPAPIIIQTTHTDINCADPQLGTATATATNVTHPVTYTWSGPSINAGNVNDQDQTGMTPGTYTVVVSDANGCTASEVVEIDLVGSLTVDVTTTAINCASPTGSVTANVTGGTGVYTYAWTDFAGDPAGSGNATETGLTGGNYTVVVTDANGCTGTDDATIYTDLASYFTLSVTPENPACAGNSNGSITADVIVMPPNAGTYIYTWSANVTTTVVNTPPPPSETATNLPAGTYSVTVVNGLGCSQTATRTLTDPQPLSLSETHQNPTTPGGSDGSIDLTVIGGTAPYTYDWSNGAITEDLTNLVAGTYCVTVTDVNGCDDELCVTLDVPLLLSLTPSPASCFGAMDGSVNLTVTGGTPGYTYSWSNNEITQDITGVPAGSYSVTVTDATGATASGSTVVGQPSQILATLVSTQITCAGDDDGAIDLTPVGGAGGYSFQWSNGEVTEDISGLAPGIYQVTVTDADMCTEVFQEEIDVVTPIAFTLDALPTCEGADNGSVDLIVIGGTPPYMFNWSNGEVTEDITDLPPGFYSVTITDANNCTATQPAVEVIELPGLLLSADPFDENCGDMSGFIDLTVMGGLGPYQYNWSNGDNMEDPTGLSAGSYDVTVSDMNGCSATLMGIQVNDVGLTINLIPIEPTCGQQDGAIVVDVPGANPPVTFEWSNGVVTQNPVLSGVGAGTYTVTVTSAVDCVPGTGCSGTATITLDDGTLTISSVVTNDAGCGSASTGTIDLFVAGGTPYYNYMWSTGAITEDISGLSPGVYDVVVTDALGCSKTASFTVGSDNSQPLNIFSGIGNPNCSDPSGFINITIDPASPGVPPYMYSWSTGDVGPDLYNLYPGTYTITVTDFAGCSKSETYVLEAMNNLVLDPEVIDATCGLNDGEVIIHDVLNGLSPYSYNWSNGGVNSSISGLAPGNYTVTVFDNGGCSVVETYTVGSSNLLLVEDVIVHPGCDNNDGSIDLTISGGSGAYTYIWNIGSFSEDLAGLSAGTYAATIDDGAGCSATYSVDLVVNSPIVLNLDAMPGTCGMDDGSIDAIATSGTDPYTYIWSNGATTPSIQGLSAGYYSVTVTDAVGCTAEDEALIEVLPGLLLEVDVLNPSCGASDGELTANAFGGVGPYTYSWSTGATTQTISNLPIGTYSVTVSDVNGCSVEQAGGLYNLSAPSVYFDVTPQVSCNGGSSNGEILAISYSNNPPVTFSWDNGATGPHLTDLEAGDYTVTITDANGCQSVRTATVWDNGQGLYFDRYQQEPTNCTTSDGYISLILNSGQPPYTIMWSTGENTPDIYNLPAGDYSVTVTDVNGCSGSINYTLYGGDEIEVDLLEVTDATCGMSDGSIEVDVSGSVGPYTFEWIDQNSTVISNNEDLWNVPAGQYGVTITDVLGCTLWLGYYYIADGDLQVQAIPIQPTCGASDGSIDVAVYGTNTPFSYAWSDGATTQNRSNLPVGTYQVTVTDASGCTMETGAQLYSVLSITSSVVDETCGDGTGSITLTMLDGTAPYSYDWSTGATTQNISGLSAGNYWVSVTDANGCGVYRSFTVEDGTLLVINPTKVDPSSCNTFDGSISVNASGGTTPYSYIWNDGSTDPSRSGLTSGFYGGTITDANGCSATFGENLTGSLSLSATATDESCHLDDGSIDLTVHDGTGPFNYYWNDGNRTEDPSNYLEGGVYSVTVVDVNNCLGMLNVTVGSGEVYYVFDYQPTNPDCGNNNGAIDLTVFGGFGPFTYEWEDLDGNPLGTMEDLTGLSSGPHMVTITDPNGCTAESFYILEEVNTIEVTPILTEPTCGGGMDGSIVINVTGGTGPYTYDWPDNPGFTGNIQTGLEIGFYPVIVTDANGCRDIELIYLVNSSQVQVSVDVQHIDCNNPTGSIDLTPTVGNPIYYGWSNDAETQDVSGLSVGTYSVFFVDANGCLGYIPDIEVREVEEMDVIENMIPATCNSSDGELDVDVIGGTPPYTFLWDNGATTEVISGVPSGPYALTITDANGCVADDFLLLVDEDNTISTTLIPTNATCGLQDGSIDVTTTGGVSPYTYNWIFDGSTDKDRTGLAPGPHAVIVTDDDGCKDYLITFIEVDGLMGLTPNITDIQCGNAGEIDLTVTGGVGPFTYNWSDGQTTNPATFTIPGTYGVTVMDVNGCGVSDFYDVVDFGQSVFSNFFESNPNPLLGETVFFTNGASGATSYDWLVDGVSMSNTLDFQYTFNDPVIVTISLVASDGNCTDQFDMMFDLTGGARLQGKPSLQRDPKADLMYSGNDINIYPNPTSGKVIVKFDSEKDWLNEAQVEVYNPLGERVDGFKEQVSASGEMKLNVLNGKAQGVYLFKIETDNGYYMKRVVLAF